MNHDANISPERDCPVGGGEGVRDDGEEGEPDHGDGGRDGQRRHVLEDEADDAEVADHHLEEARHDDGALCRNDFSGS